MRIFSTALGTETVQCVSGQERASGTVVDVTCTATDYHKTGLSCVADTYMSVFRDPGNNKTEICSGTETIAKIYEHCVRDHDQVLVDNSKCTDKTTEDTVTHKSPSGSKVINVTDGTQTIQCSEGQDLTQGVLIDIACSSPGKHKEGLHAPQTLTPPHLKTQTTIRLRHALVQKRF